MPPIAGAARRAGGKGGGDDRVDFVFAAQRERGHVTVRIGPQRVGEQGQCIRARRFDRGAEHLKIRGVPRDEMRSRRPLLRAVASRRVRAGPTEARAIPYANAGYLSWWLEAEAREQQCVGEKTQQVAQVARPAGDQIAVRLADDTGRSGGCGGELGVERGLTTARDERYTMRYARGAQRVERLFPRAIVRRAGGRRRCRHRSTREVQWCDQDAANGWRPVRRRGRRRPNAARAIRYRRSRRTGSPARSPPRRPRNEPCVRHRSTANSLRT